MPMQTIALRYKQFTRDMVRLLGGRACDCELPGLEAMLARANASFTAALPHLEQMERGCTRSDLGELQQALIDKAGCALFVVVVAVASEVGMSLSEPARLDAGRMAAIEMLGVMSLYIDPDDAAAHEAFLAPIDDCDGENAADHAS
ncbi:MAG TPA: hypothetical protein VIV58_36005 [Kofleriaceae bacterium]